MSVEERAQSSNTQENSSLYDSLKFAHGLTGTDQPGNYVATDATLIIFAIITFILLLYHGSKSFYNIVRRSIISSNIYRQHFWEDNHVPWFAVVEKHITYAPLFRKRLHNEIKLARRFSLGSLPTRVQAVFLLLYVIWNVVHCLPGRQHKTTDVTARVAEMRGRSGHLATFNLVFAILCILRNNPLIWLLGISYDNFNYFHRWLARLTILEVVLHVSCWLHNVRAIEGHSWAGAGLLLHMFTSYRWASAAAASFAIILIQSWSPVRRVR